MSILASRRCRSRVSHKLPSRAELPLLQRRLPAVSQNKPPFRRRSFSEGWALLRDKCDTSCRSRPRTRHRERSEAAYCFCPPYNRVVLNRKTMRNLFARKHHACCSGVCVKRRIKGQALGTSASTTLLRRRNRARLHF